MKKLLAIITIGLLSAAYAEPLINLVLIADGLDAENVENISDDYVRLTLVNPSYSDATAIKLAIENWLGPDMVVLDSASSIKIQAPRDSSKRVQFISALLALDIRQ
jgi:flagellar basal body P-ring protein FlgI